MEYETTVFAAQISLTTDELLDYIHQGYDIGQIATTMHSDINLVALKADALITQGHCLRAQKHREDFLKFAQPPIIFR